jgi:hypothetical protein
VNWFRVIPRLSWFHTKGFPTLVVPFCGTTGWVRREVILRIRDRRIRDRSSCRAALDLDGSETRPHMFIAGVRRPLLQNAVIQFLFSPVGGGLHEGQHHGVRLSGLGGKLRLEQGGDIKTVGG